MVMEPKLYEAAMEGNIDVLRECMNREDVQLTANNNTVLHVAVQFDKGSTRVKEILEKMGSSLLCMVNSDGDTPLHIAAGEGRIDAVKDLIDCAKEEGNELESGVKVITKMLRKTNKDGDTALHMAIRSVSYRHQEMVTMLIKEDPEHSSQANNAKETPLYLAAERMDHCNIVSEIVTTCTLSAYGGPEGRTALHAAVFAGCSNCIKHLCKWNPELSKKADINGWTPFHHAAGFCSTSMVEALLDLDKSVAYLRTEDEDDSNTALHIATSQGKEEIMNAILSSNPDCWEMANGRGQNILHIAIKYEQQKIVKFILGKPWHTNLINKKDHDGNTPIHQFATSNDSRLLDLTKLTYKVDLMAFNKKNMTPLDLVTQSDQNEKLQERFKRPGDLLCFPPRGGLCCFLRRQLVVVWLIFWLPIWILYLFFWVSTEIRWRIQNFYISGEPTKQKVLIRWLLIDAASPGWQNRKQNSISKVPAKPKGEIHRDFRKEADTNLIVATLIATVTFTAGFTMPGGYGNEGSDKGMATLARQAAFQIFVISNTLAMILSTCAVFSHFLASGLPDKNRALKYYGIATFLIVVAMIAMVVAFTAGTCGVLAHSLGLVIYIAFLGGLCSLIYCRFLWKTWRVL